MKHRAGYAQVQRRAPRRALLLGWLVCRRPSTRTGRSRPGLACCATRSLSRSRDPGVPVLLRGDGALGRSHSLLPRVAHLPIRKWASFESVAPRGPAAPRAPTSPPDGRKPVRPSSALGAGHPPANGRLTSANAGRLRRKRVARSPAPASTPFGRAAPPRHLRRVQPRRQAAWRQSAWEQAPCPPLLSGGCESDRICYRGDVRPRAGDAPGGVRLWPPVWPRGNPLATRRASPKPSQLPPPGPVAPWIAQIPNRQIIKKPKSDLPQNMKRFLTYTKIIGIT